MNRIRIASGLKLILMRSRRPIAAGLLALGCSTIAIAQQETVERLKNADMVVATGHVVRVYASEDELPNNQWEAHYVMEMSVATVKGAKKNLVGPRIFVKTSHSGRIVDGRGEGAKPELPARGDLVELNLTGGPSVYEARLSDGIRIVLSGTSRSESTNLELTLIPAGEFVMGSGDAESNRLPDESPHPVRITKAFYLGTYEVTQFEFKQVMQAKPSAFAIGGAGKDKVAKTITDRFPVENVTWFDAVEFCNRLSQKEGFEPYYVIVAANKSGESIISAVVTVHGNSGYRLPNEAEWEYACRGGSTTSFHFGVESTFRTGNVKAPVVAGSPKWKELGRTAKVGSYPANAWGLSDMHGNVAEWCENWYDKDYSTNAPKDDPRGPPEGTHKVTRGGSWTSSASDSRSAARQTQIPREIKNFVGFRVARTP